jgi:hypothetical protein
MSQRIVISNLPPETTVEGLAAGLAQHGVEAEITLNVEGNADQVLAVLVLDNVDRPAADRLAEKIDGLMFGDRRLHAFVPLFF